jgi:Protein of unknown function (DUF3050)
MSNIYSTNLLKNIEPLRSQIINHPLYQEIKDLKDVAEFMCFHVFAVWDFMSLLKALQRELTCVTIPWYPKGDAETRFLINEIVAGEESDVDENGKRISHFELYLEAMQQIGAETAGIERFLESLVKTSDVRSQIAGSSIPTAARSFTNFTFRIIEENKPHVLAAVFTFGREDLIPDMFLSLVGDLESRFPDKISILKYYLHRHIEIDGDEHSHLALSMTEKLCGEDEIKWQEAENAVISALESRIHLWNGVLERIRSTKNRAASTE